MPHVCNETLHLSFRLILCPSTSNFKLGPHIFTGSILRPMHKRDRHAPDLFLPQLCCFFPTKFKHTSSACSRLCVRLSHRADSSVERRVPAEARCTQRYARPVRGGPPSRTPLIRHCDVCRLQQRAAASLLRLSRTARPLSLFIFFQAWFIIETRPINAAGRRLCIDPDDVRRCLGNVMCLEATLNCYTFKQSIQSRSQSKKSIH